MDVSTPMNRLEYQSDRMVCDFIAWVTPIITGDRPLNHQWCSRKWGSWSCKSLFDAYLKFKWRGQSFDENVALLDTLKSLLRDAVTSQNAAKFLEAAICVVKWGGVSQKKLCGLGMAALPTIEADVRLLDPRSADTRQLSGIQIMNSGFSKIYSLRVDGLPIYDSRVACGLGSLVRMYCHERCLKTVPDELAFGIPLNQGKTPRNPSSGTLEFHTLGSGQVRKYATSNLKAAWLLEPLAELGQFGQLSAGRRLLALQSALFMVGYEPIKQGSQPS
jgi:hypothetical protein